MEDPKTFEVWLRQMIEDSKIKLNMSDRTLAYILVNTGMDYFYKEIARKS